MDSFSICATLELIDFLKVPANGLRYLRVGGTGFGLRAV
jgi:hypothetical protein